MRIALYTKGNKPRDVVLAQALQDGGLDVHVFSQQGMRDGFDLHFVVGVSGDQVVAEIEARGAKWWLFDKGYNRDFPEWWRVSYGAHQPGDFLEHARCPADRATEQGWVSRIEPWRAPTPEGHVLIAGASPNYHAFIGLERPTAYAQALVFAIKRHTSRRIVYRPKPQWRDAVPVDGAEFSHSAIKVKGRRIRNDLEGAHVMVTHGSSACLEALMAGVPTIALGGAPVRSISSTSLADINDPRIASDNERVQLISNLAYCQWSLDEFRSGQAWWDHMRTEQKCG